MEEERSQSLISPPTKARGRKRLTIVLAIAGLLLVGGTVAWAMVAERAHKMDQAHKKGCEDAWGSGACEQDGNSWARSKADRDAQTACEDKVDRYACARIAGTWERSPEDIKAESLCLERWMLCSRLGSSWQADSSSRIRGSFDLYATASLKVGGGCAGRGPYGDIKPEMQVQLKNESGKILGTTSLGGGTVTKRVGDLIVCHFEYQFWPIPRAEIFQIEGGRRGALSFPATDLRSQGWTVASTLGQP